MQTNNEKIKQVFNAINDNNINAFDDESLAKLLSILTPLELDEFELVCNEYLEEADAQERIMRVKPLVQVLIAKDLYRIRVSPVYTYYIESLTNGRYREFFKSLRNEELADLKKFITYTAKLNDPVNVSGTKKIVNLITKEIKMRDSDRKPHFKEVA